ncbi:hypothetical protein DL769_000588 [Monosporascus sp. CRB-8-3]|nr:hypothetical protein DL769_000588 [Monosporascus sp. CRB-8-3]
MKLPLIILSLPLWARIVAGFGERGAAERALYWSTYVSEEIFENAADREIAAGCVGSRTGLRGQRNRCDLLEFLDYIWAPADGNDLRPARDAITLGDKGAMADLDKKKPLDRVKWITANVWHPKYWIPEREFNPPPSKRHWQWQEWADLNKDWLANHPTFQPNPGKPHPVTETKSVPKRNKDGTVAMKLGSIKGNGYTGVLDSERLEGVARGSSPEDFQNMIRGWHEHQKRTKTALDAAKGLSDDVRELFNSWQTTMADSVEYVYDLRRKYMAEAILNPTGGIKGLKDFWKGSIETKPVKGTFISWDEVDMKMSIDVSVEKGLFKNSAEAEEAWRTAWREMARADGGAHQAVVDTWKEAKGQFCRP